MKHHEHAAKFRNFSIFNCKGLPRREDYREYLAYAGMSGIAGQYDEQTGTLKVFFTQTESRHQPDEDVIRKQQLGKARFSIILQTPDQLRTIRNDFLLFAKMVELMQDPNCDKESKDILMGRKLMKKSETHKPS